MVGRTDQASRIVRASPDAIYRALIEPEALVQWLPPRGMTGRIHAFDPRVGGRYRMTLTHDALDHEAAGKTSAHEDVVAGELVELVPGERVVQLAEFDSDDPAFAGTMRISWTMNLVPEGTEVRITCEDVPAGISREDHDAGLQSSLENLAAFVERGAEAPLDGEG